MITLVEASGLNLDLVDIGANLTHGSFDDDRDAVVQRAAAAGVRRMILTGSSLSGSQDAIELAATAPGQFFATAGVHPHHASEYSDAVHAGIAGLLAHEAAVAVGECGLDYFRNYSSREEQRVAFERQLSIAEETGKPVFLHQRDAHDDFVAILQPFAGRITRGVAHCFTSGARELEDYLAMGLYIGITGWICDERRGGHLKDIVPLIPDDRLLIETDAPYLLPRTLRPKPKSRRNEPAYLREVLRAVAASLGRSEEAVAESTTANAERFFDL